MSLGTDTINPRGGRAEVALWRAVIYQALVDLMDTSDKHKYFAYQWFFGGTTNLKRVCSFADLHPDQVVKEAARRVGDPVKFSRARWARKSKIKNKG